MGSTKPTTDTQGPTPSGWSSTSRSDGEDRLLIGADQHGLMLELMAVQRESPPGSLTPTGGETGPSTVRD